MALMRMSSLFCCLLLCAWGAFSTQLRAGPVGREIGQEGWGSVSRTLVGAIGAGALLAVGSSLRLVDEQVAASCARCGCGDLSLTLGPWLARPKPSRTRVAEVIFKALLSRPGVGGRSLCVCQRGGKGSVGPPCGQAQRRREPALVAAGLLASLLLHAPPRGTDLQRHGFVLLGVASSQSCALLHGVAPQSLSTLRWRRFPTPHGAWPMPCGGPMRLLRLQVLRQTNGFDHVASCVAARGGGSILHDDRLANSLVERDGLCERRWSAKCPALRVACSTGTPQRRQPASQATFASVDACWALQARTHSWFPLCGGPCALGGGCTRAVTVSELALCAPVPAEVPTESQPLRLHFSPCSCSATLCFQGWDAVSGSDHCVAPASYRGLLRALAHVRPPARSACVQRL